MGRKPLTQENAWASIDENAVLTVSSVMVGLELLRLHQRLKFSAYYLAGIFTFDGIDILMVELKRGTT